jgi:hypothetical protein
MSAKILPALTLAAAVFAAGCHSDKPHEYGRQRPPVDELTAGDRGLQSKDVVNATDQLAQDLLSSPELNSSRTQWTLVVTNVDNQSRDNQFNADIFTERLKVKLSQYGHGRVALIENRGKLQDLQSRELDPAPRPDNYGQGPGAPAGTNGIQPDYALYGKIIEMPNRSTSYYFCEFSITDLHTRQLVWTRSYEVKALR